MKFATLGYGLLSFAVAITASPASGAYADQLDKRQTSSGDGPYGPAVCIVKCSKIVTDRLIEI